MKRKVANQWVRALLSGKYKQGKGMLGMDKKGEELRVDPTTGKLPQPSKFCCLGVLCDVYNKTKEGKRNPVSLQDYMLPNIVMDWAGMISNDGNYKEGQRKVKNKEGDTFFAEYNLANLNDVSKKSFKYIAGVIQKNVKDL